MLLGINPLLTGELLMRLDHLGHSDRVVIGDAHFPAFSLGPPVIEIPSTTPLVAAAVRSVLQLDDVNAVSLMDTGSAWHPVQHEIVTALAVPNELVGTASRFEFYELARTAQLIIRTAETRVYANAILSKGVTQSS